MCWDFFLNLEHRIHLEMLYDFFLNPNINKIKIKMQLIHGNRGYKYKDCFSQLIVKIFLIIKMFYYAYQIKCWSRHSPNKAVPGEHLRRALHKLAFISSSRGLSECRCASSQIQRGARTKPSAASARLQPHWEALAHLQALNTLIAVCAPHPPSQLTPEPFWSFHSTGWGKQHTENCCHLAVT